MAVASVAKLGRLKARRGAGIRGGYGRRMARVLRSSLPDGIFHVTARGVAGTPIFRDDEDRRSLLRMLALVVHVYEWRVYPLCLMTNHYHLLLESRRVQLSTGMQRVNGAYGAAFNRRHKRRGHLFGERFRSWVVETEDHVSAACRYIVANPVRAGLCEDAADWPWSACRFRLAFE